MAAAQRPALEPLARAIATIPLAGYVGMDLILTPSGPIVVEVDPRLTVYVGLTEAVDINVAAAIPRGLRTGSRTGAV